MIYFVWSEFVATLIELPRMSSQEDMYSAPMGLFASFRTLLEDHPVKWKKLFQKRSYSVFRSFLRFPVKWSLHKQWHLLFQHVLHILSASSSNRSSTKKTLTFARLHRGKVEKPHSFWSFKKHPKNIHRTAAFFRCFLAVFWEEYILGPRSRLSFRIPLYFKSHASWGISEILIHQNLGKLHSQLLHQAAEIAATISPNKKCKRQREGQGGSCLQ